MSDENVKIDFRAGGIKEVQQAFATIEQALVRMDKAAELGAKKETKVRTEEATKATKARLKLFDEDLIAFMKTQDRMLNAGRAFYDHLGAYGAQHVETFKGHLAKMEQAEKASLEKRKQYNKFITGAVGSATTTLGSIAGIGGQVVALGGGVSIGHAVQRGMTAESGAIALANSMYNPNDPEQQAWLAKNGKNGRFDTGKLLGFTGVAQAKSGVDKNELLSGFQSYIAKSGDWDAITGEKGQDTLLSLAQLGKATGTNFADLMNTAGSLKAQNQALKPEEMMSMMYAMVGQGKMGNIEISDVAKHGSVITSSASKYAGSQAEAQKKLLGLVQVSGRAAGSAADASTGVARFGTDVAKKAADNEEEYKAQGFKVTDAKGQLLAPSEILAQYFKVTKGDTTKMGEGAGNLGLGGESIKVAMGSAGVYTAAIAAAKTGDVSKATRAKLGLGGKSTFSDDELNLIGSEAVRQDVAKLENAGYKKSDVDGDLKEVMATTQERYAKVTRDLTEKLEARFLPLVEKLAGALEKNAPELDRFVDAVGRVAEYLMENPFKGVGMMISANIGKELAAAGLKSATEKALQSSLGKAGLVVSSAALAIEVGTIAIDNYFDDEAKKDNKNFGDSTAAYSAAKAAEREAREGTVSQKRLTELKQLQAGMTAQLADDTANQNNKGWLESVMGYVTAPVMGYGGMEDEQQKLRDGKVKQSKEALDELNKAIADATKALGGLAKIGDKADPAHPTRAGAPIGGKR